MQLKLLNAEALDQGLSESHEASKASLELPWHWSQEVSVQSPQPHKNIDAL